MIKNELFYCKNKDTYPPFKNGMYLEEYFLDTFIKNKPNLKRKYIPALWTNFQIEGWFKNNENKEKMQESLNEWVNQNPSHNGYFTIVQHDDGVKLKLPDNTIIYGTGCGDVPIPLVYQDIKNTLSSISKKSFQDKFILCSFVGAETANNVLPNVRKQIRIKFNNNNKFIIHFTNGWTSNVDINKQYNFIKTTSNSKFALAPRGYGRSSFRFFEIFKLGCIPVYIWNDKEWLPFKDKINYSKICISLNVNDIDKLESILSNINEQQYNNMYSEYLKIKHYFTVGGIYDYVIDKNK